MDDLLASCLVVNQVPASCICVLLQESSSLVLDISDNAHGDFLLDLSLRGRLVPNQMGPNLESQSNVSGVKLGPFATAKQDVYLGRNHHY